MLHAAVLFEFSGRVRQALIERGVDAFSYDLLPAEDGSHDHIIGDVRTTLSCAGVDLIIAHPPCTHLAVSGARWFKDKRKEQAEALEMVQWVLDLPVPHIALENPISIISSRIRKPDQIVQPWMFGHPEFKATCLWLKGLPKLVPTNQLAVPAKGTPEWKAWNRVHRAPPGPDRWKDRSRTFEGLAQAMAEQWSAAAESTKEGESISTQSAAVRGEEHDDPHSRSRS
jgi:site-specific DNA-cytosine methylase